MEPMATWRSSNAAVCKTAMHGCKSRRGLNHGWRRCPGGGMAYAGDLKSPVRKGMWVRLPPRALQEQNEPFRAHFVLALFTAPFLAVFFFSPGGFSRQCTYASLSSSSDSGFLFVTNVQSG